MIDKTKTYRFKGDSERWEFSNIGCVIAFCAFGAPVSFSVDQFEHIHSRGILLEYPELPGDDWEFCERDGWKFAWNDDYGAWSDVRPHDSMVAIYCRKKKPVITEVECVVESNGAAGDRIWLPKGFAGPGDRVKVTKL